VSFVFAKYRQCTAAGGYELFEDFLSRLAEILIDDS